MNKREIRNYQIFSTIFIILLGTLLHFTYNISKQNLLVATFSAINESVWEHLKLLYFPMLLSTIIGYCYIGKDIPNFLCSKVLGIIMSILFMIVFFYTYTGILGTNFAIINILSFVVAVIIGEYITYKSIIYKFKCNNKIAICILIILLVCFIVFTYSAPRIGIFRDPLTGQYGL